MVFHFRISFIQSHHTNSMHYCASPTTKSDIVSISDLAIAIAKSPFISLFHHTFVGLLTLQKHKNPPTATGNTTLACMAKAMASPSRPSSRWPKMPASTSARSPKMFVPKMSKCQMAHIAKKREKHLFWGIVQQDGTMAQLAQNSPSNGKTFCDKIARSDWPEFCLPILDSQNDTIGQDKMMLGSLNLVSGILPKSLYSIYCKIRKEE